MNHFLSSPRLALVASLAALAALWGCSERELRPLNPCTFSVSQDDIDIDTVDEVDLLFMIDNSGSMQEEQASLADEIPVLVRTLASGELLNPDTGAVIRDFPPVRSLRVGVITSDMGTGGFSVPTCTDSRFGDDGLLINRGDAADTRCMTSYPSFFEFERDPTADDATVAAAVSQLAVDVSCVAQGLGTDGCGFEQQLDSVLKAVTPASSSLTFQESTPGNGTANSIPGSGDPEDDADDSFVRPNSLLVVIALTDEDDCSTFEPDLFNPSSTRFTGDLNLRCFNFPEAVHPISRFRDGLLALRPNNPGLLVYAAIVGIPVRLAPGTDEPTDYDAILGAPEMQEEVDPDNANRLTPSCNVPGRGLAFPPRRMVQLAQELEGRGAAGVVQSICQRDFGPALNQVIDQIADALEGTCLPRPLNRNNEGRVVCEVTEILPANGPPTETQCDMIAGRSFLETVVDDVTGLDREKCLVQQLTREEFEAAENRATDLRGWVYDDFGVELAEDCAADRQQRISFVEGAGPVTGSILGFECLQGVEEQVDEGVITVGDTCFIDGASQLDRDNFCLRATTAPNAEQGRNQPLQDTLPAGARLFCEPVGVSCQIACQNNANCPGGFVCVDVEYGEGNGPTSPDLTGVCINPTCSAN